MHFIGNLFMKTYYLLTGACILAACLLSTGFMVLTKKQRVVFFGDSITQAAIKPGGYIDVLNKELSKSGKGEQYELIGAGISGNKVPDLQSRLDKDVLAKKPDVVVVYIGINDVWHFTHPSTNGKGTPIDTYEKGLTELISKIKATGAKVILCTPSVIGEKHDGSNPQDKMLDDYAAVSRKVAKATKSTLCDLRKAFLTHLKKNNTANADANILTTDGVHLNDKGNAFVATQLIQYLK
jgi:lysophospholipase L1-like esterase